MSGIDREAVLHHLSRILDYIRADNNYAGMEKVLMKMGTAIDQGESIRHEDRVAASSKVIAGVPAAIAPIRKQRRPIEKVSELGMGYGPGAVAAFGVNAGAVAMEQLMAETHKHNIDMEQLMAETHKHNMDLVAKEQMGAVNIVEGMHTANDGLTIKTEGLRLDEWKEIDGFQIFDGQSKVPEPYISSLQDDGAILNGVVVGFAEEQLKKEKAQYYVKSDAEELLAAYIADTTPEPIPEPDPHYKGSPANRLLDAFNIEVNGGIK